MVRTNIRLVRVKNTSDTDRYTPLIAKAVHQCFGRDAKLNGMDSSDNANLVMPAAISVLKLPVGDEDDRWVDLLMEGSRRVLTQEKWPLPPEVSKSPSQSKGWRQQRMAVAGKQESLEQKLDDEGQKLYDVDFPMERVGLDKKIAMGFAGQWRALGTQGSSRSRGTEGS